MKKIKEDNELVPSFNTFYEFVQGEFRGILEEKHYREKDFDLTNFLNVLAPYYRGGEYDYLLNSDEQLDLLNKRFVVFEIDEIKEHKILFPVVTVIIMEAFINKMRRLHGVRKMIVVEEAWKAIAREGMADYIKFLYKTVRKYFGEVPLSSLKNWTILYQVPLSKTPLSTMPIVRFCWISESILTSLTPYSPCSD